MSPINARKFTNVAVAHPDRNPIEPALVGDGTSFQAGAARENALDTASHPLRKAGPARVSPSWHVDPHPYDDPCNYLG